MKAIIKSLVVSNNPKRWVTYVDQFKAFFEGRITEFDTTIERIAKFYSKFDELPDWPTLYTDLTNEGDKETIDYLTPIVLEANIPSFEGDTEFFTYLTITERSLTHSSALGEMRHATNLIALDPNKDSVTLFDTIDKTIANLNALKQKSLREQNSTASLMFGDKGADLQIIYDKNKNAAITGNRFYYPIGIEGFKEFDTKMGDLIIVGAFTSQGKSIWLRFFVYFYAVYMGLNCVFFSFEMTYEEIRMLFAILHANNKKIFPNTPVISVENFKKGLLTPEEEDFLTNVADKDLLNNPAYGSIYIDQPNKSRMRFREVQENLTKIENTIMPVHVVAVDYLTMIYPIESERGRPDSSDYNQLFKDYKNAAMSHKNSRGQLKPFIAMTAAQISRAGFDAAKKLGGIYEMSAMSHYSEIERSSDILLSSYAPDEFKDLNKIRIQNLKTRSGKVIVDPVDMFCDFSKGYSISDLVRMDSAATIDALQNLSI